MRLAITPRARNVNRRALTLAGPQAWAAAMGQRVALVEL